MDGLLIVDKPPGMTSAEVVRIVKHALRCKTGHLGTLDPFASGVLPLCLGEGTKIAQFLNAADKSYVAQIRLGIATTTGDPTGDVRATAAVRPYSIAELEAVAARFLGEHEQTPPMYSALKRQGTPLYKLARQGIEVERESRRVQIERLELRALGETDLQLSVSCSKGTYVRVLAEDIAIALGTVGHLTMLRRTRFGPFGLDLAVAVEAVINGAVPVINLRAALNHLSEIQLDGVSARRARQGYEPLLASLAPGRADESAKLIDPEGGVAAVVCMDQQRGWRFVRVFPAGTDAAA